LLHTGNFSQVRNFLLENSATLLQDDTGVPITYFDTTKWRLRAYGRYVTPIFPAYYQTKLQEFHQRNAPTPIDFGVGYRWRPNESNLLVAAKNDAIADVTGSVSQEAVQPQAEPQRQPQAQPQAQYIRPRAAARAPAPSFPIFPFFLFPPPQ